MPDKRQNIREAFLTAAFRFLGYIAHCDGQINRDEINRLKVHMKKMHLVEEEQRQALHLFKSGTTADFNASQALQEFRAATTPKLMQILLVHLITMARADGYLMEKELHKAYKILGVTADMTEDEIRRNYQKLASQLHPDKLMSQGLAQDHINAAIERFKRIQAAYSFIKKHRSLYAANG